ncbi:flavin reductase family protein [Methyloligella sp. 2.7D]|uniref:flavin reductase family protein n=1 Tax=unclassified Methyloligella TaxID=2625955 RepID=UPI00157E188F|nr:flavin reductase family protein [Methyloligella sp. GL2]QKP76884.1 flavin reductase family protein [Methyloligella sp. GL2]
MTKPIEYDPGNARHLRDVMGQLPAGVAVVCTTSSDGRPQGFTVSSFTSLSLSPPLVAFNLRAQSPSLAHLRDSGSFSVNALHRKQAELSTHFATAQEDKFAGIGWHKGSLQQPLITGALAAFECALWNEFEAGDHVIVIGHVKRMIAAPDRDPLVFHRGKYTCVADRAVPSA